VDLDSIQTFRQYEQDVLRGAQHRVGVIDA